MQQQQALMQKTTLEQKMAIMAHVALFPAMPVIVLIRRKPGYRFVTPTKLIIMFILLNALTVFGYASGRTSSIALLQIFAWGTLILGLVKRQLRWRGIKRGESWHTRSRGVSWLSTILPISDTPLKRFVEPIAVILIGGLLSIPFTLFGYYLVVAGVCLFYFEMWDYEQSLNMLLDQLDSLVDSEVMDGNIQHYSQADASQRPLDQTAGIPTGVAPDIMIQIQRRRGRRTGTSTGTLPNNVATIAVNPNGPTPGTVV